VSTDGTVQLLCHTFAADADARAFMARIDSGTRTGAGEPPREKP
jgi:hypothetical protein